MYDFGLRNNIRYEVYTSTTHYQMSWTWYELTPMLIDGVKIGNYVAANYRMMRINKINNGVNGLNWNGYDGLDLDTQSYCEIVLYEARATHKRYRHTKGINVYKKPK
jgi:hypothetical protein